MSDDEDLHDYIKMEKVKKALQHWTGEKRLEPPEAQKVCFFVLMRYSIVEQFKVFF